MSFLEIDVYLLLREPSKRINMPEAGVCLDRKIAEVTVHGSRCGLAAANRPVSGRAKSEIAGQAYPAATT